jgi:Serine carboxypeptidase
MDEDYGEDTTTEGRRIRVNETDWKNENRPVVLWLQGGPGSSSLYGVFEENGPFLMGDDKLSIKSNVTKHVSLKHRFILFT